MREDAGLHDNLVRPRVQVKPLYCSGYWEVAGNKKNSFEHYSKLLPGTLDLIQGRDMIFYSNDEGHIEYVRKLSKERAIDFTGVHLAVVDLPARMLARSMVTACRRMELDKFAIPPRVGREKGLIHYWRDLVESGEIVYCDILTIWLSKVFLTAGLARTCPPDRPVAWMDCSVSRFNGRRENFDFDELTFPTDRLSHYGSIMQFYGSPLPLNASFMCAISVVWTKVMAEFSESANRASDMAYGHDEETILADCVWRKPELFHCIGQPHIPKPKSLIRRLSGTILSRYR